MAVPQAFVASPMPPAFRPSATFLPSTRNRRFHALVRYRLLSADAKAAAIPCKNTSTQPISQVPPSHPDTASHPTTSASSTTPCRLIDLRHGCTPYSDGWDLQHSLADDLKRRPEAPDCLVLLEHHPVYTLGTASKLENVLFPPTTIRARNDAADRSLHAERDTIASPSIFRTERGGEVTYHGPGQLVVYPILNLRRHKKDLHWYLRTLEETVIHMLHHEYNISAARKDGLTGVWVGDEKVCAIGLKVSKWITMHGLALNVHMDLEPFQRIVPCGISQHGVTSLHRLLNKDVCVCTARDALLRSFDALFGPYDFQPTDATFVSGRNVNG